MEPALKQRLIGAVVISALAIYFLPKLIVGHDKNSPAADVLLQVPTAPDRNFETRELPLTAPGVAPPGGVVGMNTNAPPLPTSATPAATDANGANGATTPAVELPTAAAASTPAQPTSTTPGAPVPSTTPPAVVAAAAQPGTLIPAASAGGNYAVNAGIYSNAANAQSLVNSLKAAQLPAYTETVTTNGKTVTRVRIGPYAQRGDAEAARLHAQQVRTDMSASVTALNAAAEAPVLKPTVAPVAVKPSDTKPADSKPAPVKPIAANTAPASTPVVPATPAAVKPPTTTSVSPAAAGRGYVVQVGALRTEEEALTLRNRLRAAGFIAFSETVKTDNGVLFRVRVGPAADREAADQLRASLSQKMSLNGVVMAYP